MWGRGCSNSVATSVSPVNGRILSTFTGAEYACSRGSLIAASFVDVLAAAFSLWKLQKANNIVTQSVSAQPDRCRAGSSCAQVRRFAALVSFSHATAVQADAASEMLLLMLNGCAFEEGMM